mmetsp:Transcript_13023/g.15448  ORF Transcript_13023/g.15448 Transcript_13023/m.15448 type:complete len:634 (+) Transcript_13023:22-1923(+)
MTKESTSHIAGIDLGTTYSCIGMWIKSKVQIISNEAGNRTTASVVAFTDDDKLVGDAAKNQAIFHPSQVVYDSKRMLGKKYNDETIQDDMKTWPFKVLQGPKESILISVQIKGETREFSPEQISSIVLRKMREIGENFTLKPINDVVITVPAYFNDGQRIATKDAGALAELKVNRIVNEPTAACIAYGMDRTKKQSRERSVLIFDLGGGTFDVSILCIDGGVFEVKATHGNTHLGGEDFDRALADYIISEFEKKHPNTNLRKDDRAYRRIKSASERAKRTLSSKTSAQIELDALIDGIDFSLMLTRARFEEICEPLFKKLVDPVLNCIRDAGYAKKKIHDIVLVGGSTRIPAVRDLLAEQFKGREISNNINPDEAVAYGAAIQGAILAGLEDDTVNQLLLLDVIPLSLGIETEGRFNEVVVPKNSTIPTTRNQMFAASSEYQEAILIKVVEGERALTKDCHELGQFTINVTPQARKDSKVMVVLDIDADGLLEVSAMDMKSKNSNKLSITSDRRILSSDEIGKMIDEAKQFEEKDKKDKLILMKKIELRRELDKARSTFPDLDSYKQRSIPDARANEFTQYLNDLEMWVDHDNNQDAALYDKKTEELRKKLNYLTSGSDAKNSSKDPKENVLS